MCSHLLIYWIDVFILMHTRCSTKIHVRGSMVKSNWCQSPRSWVEYEASHAQLSHLRDVTNLKAVQVKHAFMVVTIDRDCERSEVVVLKQSLSRLDWSLGEVNKHLICTNFLGQSTVIPLDSFTFYLCPES
jgi:hypothetical protein